MPPPRIPWVLGNAHRVASTVAPEDAPEDTSQALGSPAPSLHSPCHFSEPSWGCFWNHQERGLGISSLGLSPAAAVMCGRLTFYFSPSSRVPCANECVAAGGQEWRPKSQGSAPHLPGERAGMVDSFQSLCPRASGGCTRAQERSTCVSLFPGMATGPQHEDSGT